MSNQHTESVDTVDQWAMGLAGLAIVAGVVAWPPLVALGLVVLLVYALYELLTPKDVDAP